jgi:hypothetical protein
MAASSPVPRAMGTFFSSPSSQAMESPSSSPRLQRRRTSSPKSCSGAIESCPAATESCPAAIESCPAAVDVKHGRTLGRQGEDSTGGEAGQRCEGREPAGADLGAAIAAPPAGAVVVARAAAVTVPPTRPQQPYSPRLSQLPSPRLPPMSSPQLQMPSPVPSSCVPSNRQQAKGHDRGA